MRGVSPLVDPGHALICREGDRLYSRLRHRACRRFRSWYVSHVRTLNSDVGFGTLQREDLLAAGLAWLVPQCAALTFEGREKRLSKIACHYFECL